MSIRIDDLTVTFKNGVTAVDHVDLEIPHGIFGLLGENGAGKTTLMRVLTTVLAPTNYNCLIMAKEGAEKLTINNSSSYFQVIADKDYDEALEASLQAIVDGSGRLQMRTWKNEYDTWENAIQMTRGACYAFIIILAAISIMNLINTMINSVHVRKKELGMMQAIGMSDRQLMKMLQLEGIFYTVGTLIISIGVGSLAGYPLFLYAKRTGMFDISTYHYPVTAAIIIILTLFVIQMLLAIFIAKSVRKDSLIERIRFSE